MSQQGKTLEGYFEFLDSGEIRIKGTRVGIEIVLRDYLEGAAPEEIALRYPTLSLEQIHATILYYLCHTKEMNRYLREWWREGEAAWHEQQTRPSKLVRVLRKRVEAERRRLQERYPTLIEPVSAR